MKHLRYFFVVFSLIQVPGAYAADSEGRYWLGGGTGSVSCSEFVSSMKKGKSAGIGSFTFVNETKAFDTYISGFQTGYNLLKPNTCDIFAEARNPYELLSWVENFCRANPSKRFGDAIVLLGEAYHSKRKQVCEQPSPGP